MDVGIVEAMPALDPTLFLILAKAVRASGSKACLWLRKSPASFAESGQVMAAFGPLLGWCSSSPYWPANSSRPWGSKDGILGQRHGNIAASVGILSAVAALFRPCLRKTCSLVRWYRRWKTTGRITVT